MHIMDQIGSIKSPLPLEELWHDFTSLSRHFLLNFLPHMNGEYTVDTKGSLADAFEHDIKALGFNRCDSPCTYHL